MPPAPRNSMGQNQLDVDLSGSGSYCKARIFEAHSMQKSGSDVSSNDRQNLVADVGGTNTRVGLAVGATLRSETVRKYKNKTHESLEHVLSSFVADSGVQDLDGACIAVAGPVSEAAGELTNLAWSFSTRSLQEATGASRVAILNDLQAQGHGLAGLDPARLSTVFAGQPAKADAAKLAVGVGTGFNAAPVFAANGTKIVAASECGHVPLPVSNEAELHLARALTRDFGYAEVEEVISGRGLEYLYRYMARQNGQTAELEAAQIMANFEAGQDPVAEQTVAQFIRTLAMSIGHLAMVQLPFGGIYLIGGVARAMAPHFDRFDFVATLQDKGRFSDLARAFPIYVVEDDFAALVGCADHLAADF